MKELLGLLAVWSIALSGAGVVVGVALIRRGERVWHHRVMLLATALAAALATALIRRAGGTSGRCCGRGGRGGGRGGWGRGWRRDFLDAGAEHEAGGGDRQ